jgi:hypothetical protein
MPTKTNFVPEERDFERDTQIKEAQVRRERVGYVSCG